MSERKVALVMHGMSVVGTAICRRLHDDGVLVAATWSARQRTPEAWLAAQRDDGYTFTACGVDGADAAACALVIDRLLSSHGRLDILVNQFVPDGGANDVPDGAALGAVSPDAWRAVVRRGLDGAFNMSKLVLAPMLERRWGRIVQVAAAPTWPQAVTHGAANAALHGLTKSLALELARHGVTVNTIAPGYLARDPAAFGAPPSPGERQCNEALAAAALPQIPVGRLGSGADVAGLVAYLASDAAAFVTGAQIGVNGGQSMQ